MRKFYAMHAKIKSADNTCSKVNTDPNNPQNNRPLAAQASRKQDIK